MKMKALERFTYAGRDLRAGDAFDASESDGRLLAIVGRAELVEVRPAAIPEQSELGELEPAAREGKARGRRYNRRDLSARQ